MNRMTQSSKSKDERSPYSVEVIGLIDSEGVDAEKLRRDLQAVLDPYGLTVKVLGGTPVNA